MRQYVSQSQFGSALSVHGERTAVSNALSLAENVVCNLKMTTYEADMDWMEMVWKLKSLRKSGFILNMRKVITKVDVFDEKVVVTGSTCIGTLTKEKSGYRLELKFFWTVKFFIALFYGFMLLFIIDDTATINGNSDTSLLDRLTFAGLFSVAGTFFFLIIFWDAKNAFKTYIEDELKLKTTHNNA